MPVQRIRQETRQRKLPNGKSENYTVDVPYTENVAQNYTVQVPVQSTRTENYQVQVPDIETTTIPYTVNVPHQNPVTELATSGGQDRLMIFVDFVV